LFVVGGGGGGDDPDNPPVGAGVVRRARGFSGGEPAGGAVHQPHRGEADRRSARVHSFGEKASGDGDAREAAGPAGDAHQRQRPSDRQVGHLAADRRAGRGDRPGVLHLPRGLQVPADESVGDLHVHEAVQRRRLRSEAAKNRRLRDRQPLQHRAHRLPHERRPAGESEGRVGVGGVAERQHQVQRFAAAVGTASAGVGVRELPGQAQHLPPREHQSQGHRSQLHHPRPEAADLEVRAGEVVPRGYGRRRAAEQHAHGALHRAHRPLRDKHVSVARVTPRATTDRAVSCSTRVSKREESSLMGYLKCSNAEKWIESAYEAEGPLFWATMSILLHSPQQWNAHKLGHLKRFVVLAQTRHCHPSGPNKVLPDKTVKEYGVYKPYLVFFGLIDGIYGYFFKVSVTVMCPSGGSH
jgi:hypothetical protein